MPYIHNETKTYYKYVKEDHLYVSDDKNHINIDKKDLVYLRGNKSKSKGAINNNLKSKENNAYLNNQSYSWESYLRYLLTQSHSSISNITSHIKKNKHYLNHKRHRDDNDLSSDKQVYTADKLREHIGFHNFAVFGYLFIFLVIFSIIYIIYNSLLTNKYTFKHSLNKSMKYVFDYYIFHLIPLIIAIMSGILALFVNEINGDIGDGWRPYIFISNKRCNSCAVVYSIL